MRYESFRLLMSPHYNLAITYVLNINVHDLLQLNLRETILSLDLSSPTLNCVFDVKIRFPWQIIDD